MDPVRAIFLGCGCLVALGAALTWQGDRVYSELFILPAIVAAGAYSLAPQLRWWHWKRNPPDLPTDLAPLLDRFDLYRRLDLAGKREFRRRTFLLREATHVHGQAIEEIPEDIRVMVAASAATVGFHREEFLMGDFETIIFYRHYFPSPQHDVLHCSELHYDDGAIIWTLNVFLRSCIEPQSFLHLGLYEYSRALMHLEPELRQKIGPVCLNYPAIEKLTGFSEKALLEFIGLDVLDLPAITMVLYHTHHELLKIHHPELFGQLEELFA
ncbi:hypothetical protein [Lewinella sp. W8]|uniref:hypothetical protein n=1 Tax=Lewinella sp. W8 TaxID=2528208 RepID=UPI0010679BA4|nr:hypothetical protein [Lewinella sp. W8]MTB51932.1 hypothetical protein [Lewinella sp. W8]